MVTKADSFPLSWPASHPRTSSNNRSKSRFKGTFGRERDSLYNELRKMGAESLILSSNVPLKNDGMPRADFKNPEDPGVAIYFYYKSKRMVFACDRWNSVTENVIAIRKTIEAIRGIDRWGSGDMLERAFNGFQSLPSPDDVKVNNATPRTWRDILGVSRDCSDSGEVILKRRELSRKYHPDNGTDPSNELMAEVNRAFDEAKSELRF